MSTHPKDGGPSIDPVALLDRWAGDMQDSAECAALATDRAMYARQVDEFLQASRAVQAMLAESECLDAEIERLREQWADAEARNVTLATVQRERDELRARVAELEAERADDDALRERMSDILKRTAIALRGQEPPLTAWSWHDLPERAAAAIASIDLFQRVAHNLADPRGLVPMLVDRFLCWKLPDDFAPDCGITFKRESDYEHPVYGRTKYEPVGTNLFTAVQATAMFEHLLGIDPPAKDGA